MVEIKPQPERPSVININIYGCAQVQSQRRGGFSWQIGAAQPKATSNYMIEKTITNTQKIKFTLNPGTDTRKPAKLDGKPVWTVVSGTSTIEVAPDGLSAYLISADELTTDPTVYTIEADADLGEGVETLTDTITLLVVSPRAKNLGLSAGAPEEKDTDTEEPEV